MVTVALFQVDSIAVHRALKWYQKDENHEKYMLRASQSSDHNPLEQFQKILRAIITTTNLENSFTSHHNSTDLSNLPSCSGYWRFEFSFNWSPYLCWSRNSTSKSTPKHNNDHKKIQIWPAVSPLFAPHLTHQLLPLAREWLSQSRKPCQANVCCQDKDGNTSSDLLAVSIVMQLEESVGWFPNPNHQPAPSKSHFLLLLKEDCRTVLFSHLLLEA